LSSRRRTIGFVAADAYEEVTRAIWQGAAEAAQAADANLIFFAGGAIHDPIRSRQESNFLYDLVSPDLVDGLVVMSSSIDFAATREEMEAFIQAIRCGQEGIPTVSLEVPFNDMGCILKDDYGGMQEALSHLIQVHGRRRIVFQRGPTGSVGSQIRYQAYLDTLDRFGIPFDPILVTATATSWNFSEGVKKFDAFLEERALRPRFDFDAVAGVNDELALAAVTVLQRRGIRIPDDISVIGFDDLALAGSNSPALTTVRPPFQEIGVRAVEMVLTMLKSCPGVIPPPETLPTRLVIRHSCGCQLPTIAQAAARTATTEAQTDERRRPLGRTAANPGLATALSDRRHDLIQAMVEAASDLPQAGRWAGQILNGFTQEIDFDAPGAFLSAMDEALTQVIANGGRVKDWQMALSTLRQLVLPLLSDPDVRLKADNLWHQGRVMVGELSWRNQSLKRLQVEERARQLRFIGARLATAVTLDEIWNILAQELPELGIPRSFLVLFEPETTGGEEKTTDLAKRQQPGYCGQNRPGRLVLETLQPGRQASADTGARFLSQALLPQGAWVALERYSLLVEALFSRGESLGYLVFETAGCEGGRDGDIYDALKVQVSSAIAAARLHQEAIMARMEAESGWRLAEERRTQAEEADRLKSRFLSMVSHELRTPLNVISGLTENLLQDLPQILEAPGRLEHTAGRDLERIQGSAQHLDNLIRDVLDLAVSQVGQLRLNYDLIDVNETLIPVFEVGEKLAREKAVAWRLELAPDLPAVLWDRTRLRQVALNLVTNAVKFTESGEVSLSTTLQVRGEAQEIQIAIRDTGLGIPEDEQGLIFEEFQRSERAASRGYGGLGLGLAVCRKLVELGGGKIWVESSGEVGGGSVFTFSLPAQAQTVGGRALKGWEVVRPDRSSILVVDDEPAFLDLHTRLLETQFPGFKVRTALNGREALQAMMEARPGLALLDLRMPEMDGFQVLDQMRESEALRSVPVIVLTAQPLLDDEIQRLGPGVTAVLEKGVFNSADIVTHVEAALANTKQVGSETRRVARRAMAYMHEHYGENISRKQIAEHVGVSQEYLSTSFRRETGLTPTNYLERYRIRQAKKLLETTEMSVSEVAQEVGIPDSSYFGRIFRRDTGITPAAFRKGERVS
jgi:signal transduction histidine kinase/DNA-binding LacI/PurR family transcriptional regulator/AraC-like DNA-binding protein